jgi:hypothetical protein
MADLYIYYRVRETDTQALLPRVAAMQRALAASHGLAPQLKRRPESKDGQQTWMEVYPAAPEGFDAVLTQAVDAAGIAALIAGPRHTEVFMDVEPCA